MEFNSVTVIRGELPDWTLKFDGYGDGYGYGSGSGYGYGYGYGYGDGSGDGYGDGSGDGDGWLQRLKASISQWSQKAQLRFAELLPADGVLAFWKSDIEGLPSNGGTSDTPATEGRIEEISGPLKLCTRQALHATMNPDKWQGERVWVVVLHGEVQWADDKCGSLKREIIGEIFI